MPEVIEIEAKRPPASSVTQLVADGSTIVGYPYGARPITLYSSPNFLKPRYCVIGQIQQAERVRKEHAIDHVEARVVSSAIETLTKSPKPSIAQHAASRIPLV